MTSAIRFFHHSISYSLTRPGIACDHPIMFLDMHFPSNLRLSATNFCQKGVYITVRFTFIQLLIEVD